MTVQGLTLKQIRQIIAPNLLGIDYRISSATANSAGTTDLIDSAQRFGDEDGNGSHILMTSGSNDGEETVQDKWVNSTKTYTLLPSLTNTPASGDTYERFDYKYSAKLIHDAINNSITESVGRFYVRKESVALHGDRVTARFDLPSEFDMVDRIEHRVSVESEEIHPCDRTFDETTDSDFTQTVDIEKAPIGSALKIVVAVGAAAGNFITDSISEVDLSNKTHLEGWIESNVALSAADYKIHLDDGTVLANGTDKESLSLPAISADTRTFFRIALANPEDDTAIISIGIEMDVDKGAHTVYFDDFKAVNEDSSIWARVASQVWRIDKQAKDLILFGQGVGTVGYSLLKIKGGTNPASMSTDATVATVPESYLVAKATARLLLMYEDTRTLGVGYLRDARREFRALPPLVDVVKVT